MAKHKGGDLWLIRGIGNDFYCVVRSKGTPWLRESKVIPGFWYPEELIIYDFCVEYFEEDAPELKLEPGECMRIGEL